MYFVVQPNLVMIKRIQIGLDYGQFPYLKALRSKNRNPKTKVRAKITRVRIATTAEGQ